MTDGRYTVTVVGICFRDGRTSTVRSPPSGRYLFIHYLII